jgi:hypothetical protein
MNLKTLLQDFMKELKVIIKCYLIGTAEELWDGVSGLVTKPMKGTQQEGAKGFFKVIAL